MRSNCPSSGSHGTHGSGGDVQFLDVLGAEVDHLVDVLKRSVDQQELRIGDEIAVCLVEVGVDDGVGDAGLIL